MRPGPAGCEGRLGLRSFSLRSYLCEARLCSLSWPPVRLSMPSARADERARAGMLRALRAQVQASFSPTLRSRLSLPSHVGKCRWNALSIASVLCRPAERGPTERAPPLLWRKRACRVTSLASAVAVGCWLRAILAPCAARCCAFRPRRTRRVRQDTVPLRLLPRPNLRRSLPLPAPPVIVPAEW